MSARACEPAAPAGVRAALHSGCDPDACAVKLLEAVRTIRYPTTTGEGPQASWPAFTARFDRTESCGEDRALGTHNPRQMQEISCETALLQDGFGKQRIEAMSTLSIEMGRILPLRT